MTASPDGITQEIAFATLSDSDTTPPQVLNVRATTDDTGMTTVSWFTDEDTFGQIELDSTTENTELGKNHAAWIKLRLVRWRTHGNDYCN